MDFKEQTTDIRNLAREIISNTSKGKGCLTDVLTNSVLDGETLFGNHETQLCEDGEGHLHNQFNLCYKNPGHVKFIPLKSFSVHHLPEGYRDLQLYELVKAQADLTVRVDVKITSPGRPEFWPKTEQSYPFYDLRDRALFRTGSGRIRFMYKFKGGVCQDGSKPWVNYTKCWCSRCERSDSPSRVWWEINVYTARHVVFDEFEARRTSLKLFYDSEDHKAVVLDTVAIDDVNIERDWCRLNCVTCDMGLGDRLYAMLKHCDALCRQVYTNYNSMGNASAPAPASGLAIMVSHPHGCYKQVSIGHWKDRYQVGLYKHTKLTYTTCTCPGSSGAAVYCVGYKGGCELNQLIHSGGLTDGLNISGAGIF